MNNATFNDLVGCLAKTAVSCDFSVGDAESAIWDGIRDAGYTWSGKRIEDAVFMEAVEVAKPLVKELEDFYNSVVKKYTRGV